MNCGRIDELLDYLSDDELRRVPSWVQVWVEAGAMSADEAVTWVERAAGRLAFLHFTNDASPLH